MELDGQVYPELVNQGGQLMMRMNSEKTDMVFTGEMPIPGIEPGSYILIIRSGDQCHSTPVIKE
jgi:hypothetical protein